MLAPRARIEVEHAVASARWLWRRAVGFMEALVVPALVVGGLTLLALSVQRYLAWSVMVHDIAQPDKRVDVENKTLLTLAQIFGGGFLLAGLYFTSKTFAVSREAQVTQRLSAAVESLASD